MTNFNTEFKKILQNLENNIKDEKHLESAKIEIFNLYNIFFDAYTNLSEVANSRIAELAQNQLEVKNEVTELKKILRNIEKDIYEDEDDCEEYDIEIKCPYCNNEFTIEEDEITEKEIICPNCNKSIELDWGNECNDGGCDCCSHNDCNCNDEEDDM